MVETAALLTSREVAALLRVHPKQVYRLLRRGLPARRVGAEWRFDRAEVMAWSGAEAPRAQPPSPAPGSAPPSVVAANGDVVVMLLLRAANALGAPLLGFVQTDASRGISLLEQGAVPAATPRPRTAAPPSSTPTSTSCSRWRPGGPRWGWDPGPGAGAPGWPSR